MSPSNRSVTKSVRLSPAESELVAQVSERERLAEGALLRQIILEGLARRRLELAVGDYVSGDLNLGEAAQQAGVSVQRMLAELERRGVDTITPAHFRAGLDALVGRFGGSAALRAALSEPGEDGPEQSGAPS